jgi:hypothetical protein
MFSLGGESVASQPRVLPEPERDWKRIDVELLPPCGLITRAMKLAVMDPADPDGELVAHSASSGQTSMIPITQSVMALANCSNVCFASRLMGPERKDDLCVSTVSIVCGRPGHLQAWARAKLTVFVANRTSRTRGLSF